MYVNPGPNPSKAHDLRPVPIDRDREAVIRAWRRALVSLRERSAARRGENST